MTLASLRSRAAVLKALQEHDTLGRQGFLAKYGYGHATGYVLRHQGREYDLKAIAGVAFGLEHPDRGPLRASEFSGGRATVQRALERLGFQVGPPGHAAERSYWALCANPHRYRIQEAVRHVTVDLWLVGRSDVRRGDRVAIWQTRDSEGNRGVVALGEVIDDPSVRTDVGNPYWVASGDGQEAVRRAPVRYYPLSAPLWLDPEGTPAFVSTLAVARARGGTVFRLAADEWLELSRLANVQHEEDDAFGAEALLRSSRHTIHGQGYLQSPQCRRAIEQHAMFTAVEHFRAEWDEVIDVSMRCSFDLLCCRGKEELRVEVKGTTTRGAQVILTRGEVREARQPGFALFVLSDIALSGESATPVGGRARVFHPWREERHTFSPLSFLVTLNDDEADHPQGGA